MSMQWYTWADNLKKCYDRKIKAEGFTFGEPVTEKNLQNYPNNIRIVYEALRSNIDQSKFRPEFRLHKALLENHQSAALIVELLPSYGLIVVFGNDNNLLGATMPCNRDDSLQWEYKVPLDHAVALGEVPFLRINVDGMDEYITAKVYEQKFAYNAIGGVGANFAVNIFTGWSFWWRNQQFQFNYEGPPIRGYSKSYQPFPSETQCTCFTNTNGSSYTSEWYQGTEGERTTPQIGKGNTLPFTGIRVNTQDPQQRLWRIQFSIYYAPVAIPYAGIIQNILTFDLDKYEMTAFTIDDGFE